MRIVYGISDIRHYKRSVVALGVFDGVHLGHRKILSQAVKKAREIKGTSIAITFWPLPREKESLYSLNHRLRLIRELGIQVAIVIRFTQGFSRISAERFVKDILVGRIWARHIFIGKNFRFGKKREGDYRLLQRLSLGNNFKVRVFEIIRRQGTVVSSTLLRSLISRGELSRARQLLLRPVSVLGTVVRGESRGASLGFPTANIDPHHEVLPPDGIYAVWVILQGKRFRGVCYIGKKPTFKTQEPRLAQTSIEAHIFGLRKNIYAKVTEIQFIKKLRGDKKFNSAEELASQIKKDISHEKNIFPHI
ncbi:MAG: riboflavin biosynthesis protein RibF [Candidatus Omnitrophica bacterium]|nr:riboflavin biosynthesis protein RibF [Candidatus Omnitrophota bacterium]